ncbi:MAG: DUF2203 family protein [Planctomycetes bacterium]|nr:DUF2203 family protein [Planctomycetota bacterium]
MNKAYSYQGADELIPLLRSIQREVRERRDEILRLENTARVFKRRAKDHPRLASLQAELMTHRRELRMSERELERLGCALDGERPFRVLIPGDDGAIENGFAWDLGDTRVHAIVEDPAA